MLFVDSHIHLSDYPDPGALLALTRSTGTLLFSCGVDRRSSQKAAALGRDLSGSVFAFVGIHPSEAEKSRDTEWLASLLEESSGVGEIGLDPKYSDTGQKSAQMRLFTEQLSIAEAARKPVQVHSRNAEGACLDVLGTYSLPAVLLHWFNGEAELSRVEQRGYHVSFGPALIQSKKLQRMASRYCQELILAESDGPTTFSSIGGAGGPLTVPSVLFKLAELKGINFGEMAEKTAQNASAYLPAIGKVKLPTDSGLDRKFG